MCTVRPLATLAALDDVTVVAVERENLLATAFHPELTDDLRFHRYFLEKVAGRGGKLGLAREPVAAGERG